MRLEEEFGKIMRSSRKKRGLTLKQLGEIIGISAAFCSDIENAKRRPTWTVWLEICVVLDIDIYVFSEKYIIPEIKEACGFYGISLGTGNEDENLYQ